MLEKIISPEEEVEVEPLDDELEEDELEVDDEVDEVEVLELPEEELEDTKHGPSGEVSHG